MTWTDQTIQAAVLLFILHRIFSWQFQVFFFFCQRVGFCSVHSTRCPLVLTSVYVT